MINPDLMPGKPVQTRSGLEAVTYAVHEGQKYPIIGAYKNENGAWVPTWRHADGSSWGDGRTNPLDILPKPKKLTGFINVYADGYSAGVFLTREIADKDAHRTATTRIDCIDLGSLNLTEGHGLTEESGT